MRKPLALTLLALTAAIVPVVACGSTPKKPEGPAMPASASAAEPTAPASAGAAPASASAASGDDAGASPSASASAGAGKMTAAQCDELANDALASLDAWRIKADDKCKKDTDCMPIKGRACQFRCVNGAIAKGAEASWKEAVSKVTDGQCKKWNDAECPKQNTKPPPACQDKKVACVAGKCTTK